VLYDGLCAGCRAGAARIERWDAGAGRVEMLDLREHDEFIVHHGITPGEARRVMHAITPDGEVLRAMDAVRATLKAVGRGWWIGWTRLPVVRRIADRVYLLVARHRLTLFGSKRDPGYPGR